MGTPSWAQICVGIGTVFAASYGVPSEAPRKLRADRAQERRFGFLERAKTDHRSETAFIRPFDCATFL